MPVSILSAPEKALREALLNEFGNESLWLKTRQGTKRRRVAMLAGKRLGMEAASIATAMDVTEQTVKAGIEWATEEVDKNANFNGIVDRLVATARMFERRSAR